MRQFLLALLLPAVTVSATAQNQEFQARAILSKGEGETFVAWITAATETQIRYKVNQRSVSFEDANISEFSTLYLMEPPEFAEAVDLYEGRKYETAKEKFIEYKRRSKAISTLPNNFHTLSAFYELECLRRLEDFEGLATALQSFIKEPLTRPHHLRQLELYKMWDAVRTESWDRLLLVTQERDNEELPGYQRVQVAYCKGLALQNLERVDEALVAYATAIAADAGASANLVQKSAFNSLRMYHEDEEVQLAIKNWGTDDEDPGSVGYQRLVRAAAFANFYSELLMSGQALPAKYADFLQYHSEDE